MSTSKIFNKAARPISPPVMYKRKSARFPLLFLLSIFALSACIETIPFPGAKRSVDVEPISSVGGGEIYKSVAVPTPVRKPAAIKNRRGFSEDLLKAEGNWNVIEQSKTYDPAEAHLMARKNVNVRRRSKMKELAPHFEPDAKSGQDGKTRVLKIEDNGDNYGSLNEEGYGRKASANTEGGFFGKVTSLFGIGEEAVTVIPKRKPRRGAEKNADVQVGQLDLPREDLVSRGERHMQGGVVVPPPVPLRKVRGKKVVEIFGDALPSARTASFIEPVTMVAAEDVIIPKRKPKRLVKSALRDDYQPAVTKPEGAESAPAPVSGVVYSKSERVLAVRSGSHPGKTRVVLDVTGPVKYRVMVDDLRNVLRVRLDNVTWEADEQGSLASTNPLLGSYITRQSKDGSILFEVRVKQKATLGETVILNSSKTKQHRIVIDLKT